MPGYKVRPLAKINTSALQVYPLLAQTLLRGRDIRTAEEAAVFLTPDWERDIHDPFLMKGMQTVVDRIVTAMQKNETIVIWSDYDMDGIPGAALFYDFFRAVQYDNVLHHTPHRNRDGFGLNKKGLDSLKEKKADLVITIDCGIGDVEMVAYANTLGFETIVTDHHLPHDTLPPAYAILNPKQTDCTYPEKMLCGAGVIFKLVQGLLTYLRKEEVNVPKGLTVPGVGWEKWLLDMAGMSTVADMVPLTGENRALAYFGLVVLKKSRRPGLQALLKKARANQRYLSEDDIAFTIAPRVNAASRMGHASEAFKLLSTQDLEEAGQLAESLDSINKERKTTVAVMKREIKHRLEKLGEPKSVIVMGNPEWKPSLLGLVAGGLVEEFNRPVFLWGREEGLTIKGSCRSEGTTNVFEVMHHAKTAFIEYGGHAAAGGFSLEQEEVHTLEEALVESHEVLQKGEVLHEKYFDSELTLTDVTWDTFRTVNKLAPFGEGNPKPLFMFRNVTLASVRMFGKGSEHLEATFSDGESVGVKAISFFSTVESFSHPLREGEKVSFVAHLEASYFRYKPELRLRLVDVLPS